MAAYQNKTAWVRASVPDELKISFVISRATDPELHAHLSSPDIPFRQGSEEVRRLLRIGLAALKGEVPAGREAPTLVERVPLAQERISMPKNDDGQLRSNVSKGDISKAVLDAIDALDAMSS